MWISIDAANATTIFIIAKPQINTLANEGVFDKVSTVVEGNDIVDPATVIVYSTLQPLMSIKMGCLC